MLVPGKLTVFDFHMSRSISHKAETPLDLSQFLICYNITMRMIKSQISKVKYDMFI